MSKQVSARASAARAAPRRSAGRKQVKTAPSPQATKAASARAVSASGSAAAAPRAKAALVAEAAAPRIDDRSDLAATASANTLAFNPLTGLRREDIAAGAGSLLKMFAAAPRATAEQYGRYLKELARVAGGASELAPDQKDKRFADPAWRSNAFYKALMQAHTEAQQRLGDYVESRDLDKREKGKAQFFVQLITDALAPSNWLLGNPAAVRKIVDTGGQSVVDGVKNMLDDWRHDRTLPSSVDASGFKVGGNLA